MTSLRLATIVVCFVALGSFAWGMLKFFQKPSGDATRTRSIAVLGLGFAVWHLWTIAVATTGRERNLAAIALYAATIALYFWAVRSFGELQPDAIFSTAAPRGLVIRGPYRYVRHPFYTAYILFWSAGWIASGSAGALASIVVMSAAYISAARREEAMFQASSLSETHAAYCRRTGFMVPRLR